MNKTFITLLALVTLITFASGATFAGAEGYIPSSAEGLQTVENNGSASELLWQNKTLADFNSQGNQATVYVPYSAEGPQFVGNSDQVWTLGDFNSQGNEATIYIPCSAEATTC